MAKNNNKIKEFFKKIYYSIFKIEKYGELLKDGLKISLIYVRNLIFILAAIYATIYVVRSTFLLKNYREYLIDNLPDFTCENGILTVDSEERVVLDNDLVKSSIGAIIVIDTTPQYENAKNEYTEKGHQAIIMSEEKIILINKEGNVKECTYTEFLRNYFSEEVDKIEKQDIINIISNMQSPYYFVSIAISYVIVNLLFVLVYNLIVTYILYVMYRCKKNKIKFSEIFTIGIYASTILTFGILIVVFMPPIWGSIIEITLLITTVIYEIKAFKLNLKTNKNKETT